LSVKADSTQTAVGLTCQTVDATAGSSLDLQVPDDQPLMVKAASSGEAFLTLWFLGQRPSAPILHAQLEALTPEWVHLPNTGKSAVWQLNIRTTPVGLLQVCGISSDQIRQVVNYVYLGQANTGALGPGWSSVVDSGASGGLAAMALAGSPHVKNGAFANDTFGSPITLNPGSFDVWYRIRAAGSQRTTAEMTLGLWDDTAVAWIGSSTYKASQVATTYSWVKVAGGVIPASGHVAQFQASIAAALSTDWYIDQAVVTPAGSTAPTT